MGRCMKCFDPRFIAQTVRVQKMPESLANAMPDADDLIQGLHEYDMWFTEVVAKPISVAHRVCEWGAPQVSGRPQLELPESFKLIQDVVKGHSFSVFHGVDNGSNGTLDWHTDSYHVWAFNLEGTTRWEWFDIIEGKVKSAVIEPLKTVITMPSGTTHQVKLLSDTRTSVSAIFGDRTSCIMHSGNPESDDRRLSLVDIDNLNDF